eukprot:gene12342-25969_t
MTSKIKFKKSNKSETDILSLESMRDYALTIQWDRGEYSKYNRKSKKESSTQDFNSKYRLIHIINIYPSKSSQNQNSQRLTMATIEVARMWMSIIYPNVEVEVVVVEGPYSSSTLENNDKYPLRPINFNSYSRIYNRYMPNSIKNLSYIKNHFSTNRNKTTSISTSTSTSTTKKLRAIPLLKDILLILLHEVEIPDFIIDHNYYGMNISKEILHEHMLKLKLNNVNFNDRNVYKSIDIEHLHVAYEYALMYRQLHPGYDCLVLRQSHLPEVIRYIGDVYTGFPPVGSVLAEAVRTVNARCAAT